MGIRILARKIIAIAALALLYPIYHHSQSFFPILNIFPASSFFQNIFPGNYPFLRSRPPPWGNEDTAKILSILDKMNVKVTFFMTGSWVESYPEDVKAIYDAGHDLGNHSERHKDMATIGIAEQQDELMSVHQKVKELTGYEMTLFRPPYGSFNNDLITTAEACGYYPIQWSVDSLDWKDYGTDSIISTVCEHKALGCGAIILMHNGATYTADALETIITNIQEAGYEIVPISQLIYRENYHLDVSGKQISDSSVPDGGSRLPESSQTSGEVCAFPAGRTGRQGV